MPALSALTEAFPDDILPEHVSEEAFLWAAQLWYSYGMEVSADWGSRFNFTECHMKPALVAACAL